MGFNKQNTLHGLHVHDDARFSVFRATCVIIKNSFPQNNSSAPKAKISVRSDPIPSPVRSDPSFVDGDKMVKMG